MRVADVPATQLSFWGTHGIESPMASNPPELLTDVAAIAPKMAVERDHVEGTDDAADREFWADMLESIERRGRIARLMLDPAPDLAVMVFSESHSAGHRLWHRRNGWASCTPRWTARWPDGAGHGG